jgi:hypothetical protein
MGLYIDTIVPPTSHICRNSHTKNFLPSSNFNQLLHKQGHTNNFGWLAFILLFNFSMGEDTTLSYKFALIPTMTLRTLSIFNGPKPVPTLFHRRVFPNLSVVILVRPSNVVFPQKGLVTTNLCGFLLQRVQVLWYMVCHNCAFSKHDGFNVNEDEYTMLLEIPTFIFYSNLSSRKVICRYYTERDRGNTCWRALNLNS